MALNPRAQFTTDNPRLLREELVAFQQEVISALGALGKGRVRASESGTVFADYNDVVRLDPPSTGQSLVLPPPRADRAGSRVSAMVVSSSGAVTVEVVDGTINGASTLTLLAGVGLIEFELDGAEGWYSTTSAFTSSAPATLAGRSVLGRPNTSTGAMSAISATVARHVLRLADAGTPLGFGFPVAVRDGGVDIGDFFDLNFDDGTGLTASVVDDGSGFCSIQIDWDGVTTLVPAGGITDTHVDASADIQLSKLEPWDARTIASAASTTSADFARAAADRILNMDPALTAVVHGLDAGRAGDLVVVRKQGNSDEMQFPEESATELSATNRWNTSDGVSLRMVRAEETSLWMYDGSRWTLIAPVPPFCNTLANAAGDVLVHNGTEWVVAAGGGSTSNFLRGDGTFAAPAGGGSSETAKLIASMRA